MEGCGAFLHPSIRRLNVFSSIGSPRCLISGSGLKGRRMSKPYLRPFKPERCSLPLNPFASRVLQQQGRRLCSEEASQGLAEIRIVVVPIHTLKIAPSIDCEEFEGLGHSWLSESEVYLMGQMPGSPGLVDTLTRHLIQKSAGLLTGHNGPTNQSEETVVVSCGCWDMVGKESFRRLPYYRVTLSKDQPCSVLHLRIGEELVEPAWARPQVHDEEFCQLLINRNIDHVTQITKRLGCRDAIWRSSSLIMHLPRCLQRWRCKGTTNREKIDLFMRVTHVCLLQKLGRVFNFALPEERRMTSGEIDCIHVENHAAHLEELWEEIQTFLAAKQMEKAKDMHADLCRFPREYIL